MTISFDRALYEGNVLDRVAVLEREVERLKQRDMEVDKLSDLTTDIGTVDTGILKFGNDTDLGSGFSGVMGGYPGVDLDTPDGVKNFLIAAIIADALGAGFTDQGELYAQAGKIAQWVLDNDLLRSSNFGIVLDAINEQISVGSTGTKLLLNGIGKFLKSSNYATGYSGVYLDSSGYFEAENAKIRGSIETAVFKKNMISAQAGAMIIAKSAGVLSADYTTGGTLVLQGPADGSWLFGSGDIIRLGDGINTSWISVTQSSPANTYTTSLLNGASATYPAGSTAVDYGPTDSGWLEMQAGAVGSAIGPYYSVKKHSGQPWTATTEYIRLGDLRAFLDCGFNTMGFGIGDAASFLTYDPVRGLRIKGSLSMLGDGMIDDAINMQGIKYSLIHSAANSGYSRVTRFGQVVGSGNKPVGVLEYLDPSALGDALSGWGGFETKFAMEQWTHSGGGVLWDNTTAEYYEGAWSAFITQTFIKNAAGGFYSNQYSLDAITISNAFAVTAGKYYDVTWCMKAQLNDHGETLRSRVVVSWLNSSQTVISTVAAPWFESYGAWKQTLYGNLKAPTGAAYVKVTLQAETSGAPNYPGGPASYTKTIYVDRIQIYPSATNITKLEFADDAIYANKPLSIGSGYSMPGAPTRGLWNNDKGIIYWGENNAWLPVVGTKNMACYVSTSGTDDQSHGQAGGSSAYRTVSYAINSIPLNFNGTYHIYIEAGTFTETVWISDKRAAAIHIWGTLNTVATRTETITTDPVTGWSNIPSVPFGYASRIIEVSGVDSFINSPNINGANVVGHASTSMSGESRTYTEYTFGTTLSGSIYVTDSTLVSIHNLSVTGDVNVWYGSNVFIDRSSVRDFAGSHNSYLSFARSYARSFSVTQNSAGNIGLCMIGTTYNMNQWWGHVTSAYGSSIVVRTALFLCCVPNAGQRVVMLQCSESSDMNCWGQVAASASSGINVVYCFAGGTGTLYGFMCDCASCMTSTTENTFTRFYGVTPTAKYVPSAATYGYIG
jgi:hypothetical protein